MKIYLDMDGVIADFFGSIEKKFNIDHWKQLDDPVLAIEGFRNTDWFYTLKPFDTSAKLVEAARNIAGYNGYGICSSPITNDDHNSGYWKRRWLEDNGFMPKVKNFIITQEKWKFATEEITGEPNILVDDKFDNITRWRAAGGIGLRYQANESDIDLLIKDMIDCYS
tara:strand:+ start:5323 stop:5823 length:501 start_codon:yes stop_codon:yes gene_type:complete